MTYLSNTSIQLLALSFVVFNSCQNTVEQSQNANTSPDTLIQTAVSKETGSSVYQVVKGEVRWIGKKALGSSHQGTIQVEAGELVISNSNLVSGKITIDMNSLAVTDIQDAGERRDLESHLKDADFFEVEKFPKAEFVFDQVVTGGNNPNFNAIASGQLTMKGKVNRVNIPVKLDIDQASLKAESASFLIDRTKWGVNFRSSALHTVKDKLIEDNVILTFSLEAKKQ
ncbi:MAG: YceI family protein [Saprospiraceae bacterium]|nr:YceI family protein [Saprospiraceae bacterium]